ncbi:MAG: helix-turn-helix domain-containing protein [Bacteroidales bacterium]|nr:helix-turn-helix domain-containing protein [Bacteroidales bacterium]
MATLAVGCTGAGVGENGRKPQAADTLYTAEKVRETFYQDPERALPMVDSAERLGTMDRTEATLLRARIYSNDEATLDETRTLCRQLLAEGGLTAIQQTEALDMLVYVARMRDDDEGILKYGMQYINACRQMGNEAEALFTQSEMGEALIRLGRTDEGFAKIDDAIAQLDKVRRFREMDACVRAMKGKIRSLDKQNRYEEIIPVAERIVEKMSDYGEHPADYDDGSNHMPADERRPGYIDWYTGQAYAFMVYAYAMQASGVSGNSGFSRDAKRCLALFNQTDYSKSVGGKKMISATWCLLGEYDKMLAFYDELEALWGSDTLHSDYAIMLRDRAKAARAKGNYHASDAYMQRYANLLKKLNDSERLATAQEYAARYHEQEQQLALEQEQAAKHRMAMIIIFLGVLTLMAIAFIVITLRQLRDIRKKNAVLTKEIADRLEYEELYRQTLANNVGASAKVPTPDELAVMGDAALFEYLRGVIFDEELYHDPLFDRQQLEDRFHISKERIGAAFAHGSPYGSLKGYLIEVRLEHAAKLLTEQPDMPVADVADACGFGSATVFNRNFKQRFTMTPSEFRNKN